MVLSLPAISIQLGLLLHAGVVMIAWKFSAGLNTCDCAMKPACSAGRSAELVELRRVEVRETVGRFLDRGGLAEVARKPLSVLRLSLPHPHVSGDVHQSYNRRIRSGLGDYRPTIAMSDKNAR
jgi:hypothetical protein